MDGGWSGWSGWSGCAPGVCAGNQRIRTRTCTNPIPSDDGKYCDGESAEGHDCLSKFEHFIFFKLISYNILSYIRDGEVSNLIENIANFP